MKFLMIIIKLVIFNKCYIFNNDEDLCMFSVIWFVKFDCVFNIFVMDFVGYFGIFFNVVLIG